MATRDLAATLRRTENVLRRRPSAGLHDDSTSLARWDGGVRVVARHAGGHTIATDLSSALGGSGDEVTPGWLLRAGLACCTASSIAMEAAGEGIELDFLEVEATSRSDVRGMFGLADNDGAKITPGPLDVRLHVRLGAAGVAPERLRALVRASEGKSPVMAALQTPTPVSLSIETGDA